MDPIILHTERLILRTPKESDIPELLSFEKRNISHLSPWRSTEPTIDLKLQMQKWQKEFKENRFVRFLLFLKTSPEVIGLLNFSQIFRGPFQACYLGYHIDKSYEGQGLMSECVKEATMYMFKNQNLHRIMANYMPSNLRSARLLQKQGFVIEGLAKNYLLINGKWEDHVLTSLTNPNWNFS